MSTFGKDDFGQGGFNDQVHVDLLLQEIEFDRAEIDWRKDFVGFDDGDTRRLQQYKDVFRESAEQVADDFYDNLTDDEQTIDVIGRSEKGVERLADEQLRKIARWEPEPTDVPDKTHV